MTTNLSLTQSPAHSISQYHASPSSIFLLAPQEAIMAPFPLAEFIGKNGTYIIYLLIGMGFGAALEMSGFAISTKLTGQFYFKDQTVFKVMFTGVVVAMVLTFGAVGLGLARLQPRLGATDLPLVRHAGRSDDRHRLHHRWLLSQARPSSAWRPAKIDAFFYIGGVLTGIVIFGETFTHFDHFFNSASYMGRFTIPEWLGLPTSVVVFGVTVMAVLLIWGAEHLERVFRSDEENEQAGRPSRWRFAGAAALVAGAFGVLLLGQPSDADLWQRVAEEKEQALEDRLVQIHPAELRHLYYDPMVNLVMLDVRDESDYNVFHIRDSRRIDPEQLVEITPDLQASPGGTVIVLMGNDETRATEAWKSLVARDVRNIYILEGGLNNWLAVYGKGEYEQIASADDEALRYVFAAALGDQEEIATPHQHDDGIEYESKVIMEKKAPTGGGGCG
jgi:rhodanese-related sulfurtransferase